MNTIEQFCKENGFQQQFRIEFNDGSYQVVTKEQYEWFTKGWMAGCKLQADKVKSIKNDFLKYRQDNRKYINIGKGVSKSK